MFGYGTLLQPGYYFSRGGPPYNASVKRLKCQMLARVSATVALAAATVALVLLVLPSPHRRLHYVIAGTAGTGVWLGMALAGAIGQIRTVYK
jgi:hypothetical protein